MATTTTTDSAELETRADPHADVQSEISNPHAVDSENVSTTSRLADSTVPDGGYGWVVVLGCAILTFLFYGTTSSWGIFQAALVEHHLASTSTLSFVGSVTVFSTAILALAGARVLRLLGSRTTAIIGILLLGTGDILSGFTTDNIGGLFVTAGFVTGLGTCLCFMVCSVIPNQWFSTKLGLANGLVKAGGGLGGAVLSLALDAMIQKFGPAWAFRILGFLTLATGLPAAWIVKERYPIRSATFIEWHLFRDFSFLMLFLAGAIATFALFVPAFFLPLYTHSLGLPSGTGAALLAGFNFSTAIGRLGSGYMCDTIGSLNTFIITMLINAISMLSIWPVSNTLAPLTAFAILNGVANGSFFTSMPTAVGTLFGSGSVAVAMGMIVTGWAGGYFAGAPIAGYILQAYGGKDPDQWAYRPAIFYAGSVALAAAGFVLSVRLRLSLKILKKL